MSRTKLAVSIVLLMLAVPLVSGQNCSETIVCSDTEEDLCQCIFQCPFDVLEDAMQNGTNQYKIWSTFHHPREALPLVLSVTYRAHDRSDVYLWTSNTIYFVITPQVFGLLSLFLGYLDDDHTGCLDLELPNNCSCWLVDDIYQEDDNKAIFNYLEVLTEKVCIKQFSHYMINI